jgi:glutamine synthetase
MSIAAAAETDARTERLADLVAAHDVRFVLAMFVDVVGKPCAKLVPARSADALQDEGVGFAGFAAGPLGQHPWDPDMIVLPDPASFTPLPMVRPGLAVVHCDPYLRGERWPFAPRVILRAVVDRQRARGRDLRVGAEAEYFLVERGPDGALAPADHLDRAAQPCYDAHGVTRMWDHLTAVSDAMNDLGWGNYANDHEDANGQFEQNFDHDRAVVTADRVITLRYLVRSLAEQRGLTATFMPKPFTDRTGNGLHLHQSLWAGHTPLFPRGSDADPDPYGLGLSDLAYGYVAGLIEHAPALSAVIAPTVNSYKRSGARSTASGATWAPRRATYGGNDRSHLVRVPDGDRVELRAVDGSANPYLAAAAVLTAGADGVDRGLDPGPPQPPGGVPDDAPELPRTLLEATQALLADPVVCGALDAADPSAGVSAYYAGLKREEFYDWHSAVSAWEVDRSLRPSGGTTMCGIAGLQLRDPALFPRLGALLAGMTAELAERGPDSAGFGIYGDPGLSPPGEVTLSLLDAPADAAERLAGGLELVGEPTTGVRARVRGATTLVSAPVPTAAAREAARLALPDTPVIGYGEEFAVLKEVGAPADVARRLDLATVTGRQAVAHTRMATESAVTRAGCHPFSVGPNQCLVHNGSFHNHATVRRELARAGVTFDSANDSEVGARFVAHQLAAGADLEKALRLLGERFDGFFTLLVTAGDAFAVVRDRIACKPAVVAETSAWVATASEYRALCGLPGIERARVFEPEPDRVYLWTR